MMMFTVVVTIALVLVSALAVLRERHWRKRSRAHVVIDYNSPIPVVVNGQTRSELGRDIAEMIRKAGEAK